MLVSESTRPRYDQPPCVNGESVLVIGDAQVPFHDASFINNIRRVASAWRVRQCIWAGDMADLASFSIFLNESVDAEAELDETHLYLAEIASGFETVTWLMGNHEQRFQKAINRFLSLERVRLLLGLGTHIHTSNYFYALVGSTWRVTHPKNTSVVAGRVPSQLAEKYRMNVASFHGHYVGLCPTRDGRFLGVDVGMCADAARLEYVATRDNTRPVMNQGALILRWDGECFHPHLFSPLATDWDYEIQSGHNYRRFAQAGRGWD